MVKIPQNYIADCSGILRINSEINNITTKIKANSPKAIIIPNRGVKLHRQPSIRMRAHLFLALESTDFSSLIYDLKIQVRVKATSTEEVSITFHQLSEGEQQLLMVLGLMRFTKSHQSLVLLDEPDTHINPHWSVHYLNDLARVMSDDALQSPEQQTSQTLMATHDPLVIASLVKEQIHLLKRDPKTGARKWVPASVNPRGLGYTGILTSEMFGFRRRLLDASDSFLAKLKGVIDPERKRKIIGKQFIEQFEAEAKQKSGGAKFLVQGTLYPDVIESVSFKGPSATIKTHHNVGGLPMRMKLKLIEPLRELFKDEVRVLGKELGLPDEIVWRQPFPGPGLAIRVLGAVTRERLAILRAAKTILDQEIRAAGLYREIWQSLAVLLPIRTVGVMGDQRTYEHVVSLRAVTSLDGMTADWAKIPNDVLGRISNRIINEVKGVNRVVYDISSKPPATIEWE